MQYKYPCETFDLVGHVSKFSPFKYTFRYFIPNSRIKVHNISSLIYYGFCIKNVLFNTATLQISYYIFISFEYLLFSFNCLLFLSSVSLTLFCLASSSATLLKHSCPLKTCYHFKPPHSTVFILLFGTSHHPSFFFIQLPSTRPSRFSSNVIFSGKPSTPSELHASSLCIPFSQTYQITAAMDLASIFLRTVTGSSF